MATPGGDGPEQKMKQRCVCPFKAVQMSKVGGELHKIDAAPCSYFFFLSCDRGSAELAALGG